ncbi:pirin family protein [Diaphorobacter aerolatus]|uniref:Pirin family protein n=1 Tax=Diaphorobacter aerolatus TaxID=1288495 RepID=A0A7H0GKD9_9BURK|nr:pirin family protein [Diaphorobacter aerolatus]QNP48755.1 pirin family protein [Diaphorobacter aerolatus]
MTINRPRPLRLSGHVKDLGGGFVVRRMLPSLQCRAIGPFMFFDHFGPVKVVPQSQIDVRPHPHIGLSTVTYLFEGAMMHRDNLGSEQLIEPGAINWMTAGRGVVHSERRPQHLARSSYVNHGIQLWAALPLAHEQTEPSFTHTPESQIPQLRVDDAEVRVLIGSAYGHRSPVKTFTETLYLDIQLGPGGGLELPAWEHETAVYTVDGDVMLAQEFIPCHTLAMLEPRHTTQVNNASKNDPLRLIVMGGMPLDAPRHLWWNFVASDTALIERAAQRWEDRTMGSVPGDDEFIPLPERYVRRR